MLGSRPEKRGRPLLAMSEEENFKVTDRRGRAEGTPGGASPPPEPAASAPTSGPSQLSSLFVLFANSALIGLGAVAPPGSEERRVDLEQARSAIDILLMLRDKTQGNRTEPESRLLEEIVYDLQMRFVQTARERPA